MSKAVRNIKKQNKVGTVFALVELENGNYRVHKLCSNYDGNVKSGISKKWRIVQPSMKMNHKDFQEMAKNGMKKENAEKLFKKRINGSQK